MTDGDRFRLLFGPYSTPLFEYGDVVTGEVLDRDVVIVDITDARIRGRWANPRAAPHGV